MENKARFLCSYGGEIKPHDGDNLFFYDGGDNKMLLVDRGINFKGMTAELSALCGGATVLSFKYQIPGDELDTLVSVTNDRDLSYMMREFDLHYPPSATTGRMRIFLFPATLSSPSLISGPDSAKSDQVDIRAAVPPPPAAVRFVDPQPDLVAPPPECEPRVSVSVNGSDKAVASAPRVNLELEGQWQSQDGRVLARASFSLLGPLTPTSASLVITLLLLVFLVPFTLVLKHHAIRDVDAELKNVGVVAEAGPDHTLGHVDKPMNHWSLQRQSLPDTAGGVTVYAPTDEKETTFPRPWGPLKAKAGCADAASSSLFDPLTATDFYVFITFRGKDTGVNFFCHLHQALTRGKVKVLIDYKLPEGHKIWPSLLRAIENSYVSVVVFSGNYASSEWSLQELVKILESMKERGQAVLPVFYNIDPTHVRHQLGSFKEAFDMHLQNFDHKVVQNWKDALIEAADLFGWDSQSRYSRDDAELVQQIVKDVLEKRNHACKSNA